MAPTTLHNHALAGEDDEIRRIASRGTTLEAQDASGWTALHYAAAVDRPSTVGVLLGLGRLISHQGNWRPWLGGAVNAGLCGLGVFWFVQRLY